MPVAPDGFYAPHRHVHPRQQAACMGDERIGRTLILANIMKFGVVISSECVLYIGIVFRRRMFVICPLLNFLIATEVLPPVSGSEDS